jgi:hypothetical protein
MESVAEALPHAVGDAPDWHVRVLQLERELAELKAVVEKIRADLGS